MNANDVLAPEIFAPPPQTFEENGGSASETELKVNILLVDDRADKLLALEAILGSLSQNLGAGPLGQGRPPALAQTGFRRDPPRCFDAGHGRLRDGRSHPQTG